MMKKTINVLQEMKERSVGLGQAESLHSLLDELNACSIFYLVHVYLYNCPWVMLCPCNHVSLSCDLW